MVGSIKNSEGQVLDTLHGSWLTHLEWEKGVSVLVLSFVLYSWP